VFFIKKKTKKKRVSTSNARNLEIIEEYDPRFLENLTRLWERQDVSFL